MVTLTKIKRSAGISRPKKYGFHKKDTLLHDLILYIKSLTFANNAFKAEFYSFKNIYRLIVPQKNNRIIFP